MEARDGYLECKDVNEVTMAIMIRSSFNGFDKHAYIEGKNPNVALDQDEMGLSDSWDVAAIYSYHLHAVEHRQQICRESAIFCLELLEKTPQGYTVLLATSPENEFMIEGETLLVSRYTENINAMIRGLFKDYLKACDKLKKADELYIEIKKHLPLIVPIQIGLKGQILEWDQEFVENTKQYEAVRESLLQRGDAGTGWRIHLKAEQEYCN